MCTSVRPSVRVLVLFNHPTGLDKIRGVLGTGDLAIFSFVVTSTTESMVVLLKGSIPVLFFLFFCHQMAQTIDTN